MRAAPAESRPGFTLVELLVTMAVIGVVLALTLPVLSAAREKGRETVWQSRMRTHAQVFHVYAGDHAEAWPNVARPDDQPTWHTVGGEQRGIAFYFGQVYVWHIGLLDRYYDANLPSQSHLGRTFRNPDDAFDWHNDFLMSSSLLAAPAFWNPATRTGPSQWRGTRVHQVRYAGRKAILVEGLTVSLPAYPPASTRLLSASADGAAAYRPIGAYTDPYPTGDGDFPGSSPGLTGRRALHTIDGVLGRDW